MKSHPRSIQTQAQDAPIEQIQTVCGQRDDIVSQLKKKYGEIRQNVGVQQGRGVMETYASEETGSWTIIITDTADWSCLLAAGEAYENTSNGPKGDPITFDDKVESFSGDALVAPLPNHTITRDGPLMITH